jgi:uncharacterized protein (DUF1778 family)
MVERKQCTEYDFSQSDPCRRGLGKLLEKAERWKVTLLITPPYYPMIFLSPNFHNKTCVHRVDGCGRDILRGLEIPKLTKSRVFMIKARFFLLTRMSICVYIVHTNSEKGEPTLKTERINLRATPQQQMLIQQAAEIKRKSISEFILESACAVAENALLDQRIFFLNDAQWIAFQEALNSPPVEIPALKKLMEEKAPWE